MAQGKHHEITVTGWVQWGSNERIRASVVVDLAALDDMTAYEARECIRGLLRDSVINQKPHTRIDHVDTIDALLTERRQ